MSEPRLVGMVGPASLLLSVVLCSCGGEPVPVPPSSAPPTSSTTPDPEPSVSASSPPSSNSHPAPESAQEPPLARAARDVVAALVARRFDEVVGRFDATMAGALPAAQLAETWDAIVAGAGAYRSISRVRIVEAGAYRTALVSTRFARAELDLKIAFDRSERLAGFFVAPTPPAWEPPAYAGRSVAREVIVNPGPWALPGTLTLPEGAGPFPAVVLVHGSGPSDRDATVGAVRPFADLALGLAARGVAVLRHEKRTREHGARIDVAAFGLDDESVDDAIAAFALLAAQPEVDPKRVAVVGHSLGGTFAPRIAEREPRYAGAVLLAGATRAVPEMMIEQMEYLAGLDGRRGPEEDARIAAVKAAAARITALRAGAKAQPGEVVLGAGPRYWLELGAYDPLATVKRLPVPVFVAQGGRDYQVGERDFAAWSTALAGRPRVTLRRYPAANHLFVAGEGPSVPEEYERGGHVERALVDDLASWVRALPPSP